MTVNEKTLEQELKGLIAEIMEVEPDEVTPEANFVENLGMDSMTALEIMASIEKKYRIRIPEDDLKKIVNLKQTVELAKNILEKSQPA